MEVMYLAATWWSCIYAVLPPGDRADVCVNITTGQVNKVCRITVSGNVYGWNKVYIDVWSIKGRGLHDVLIPTPSHSVICINRQAVMLNLITTLVMSRWFQKVSKKADICIILNTKMSNTCWWKTNLQKNTFLSCEFSSAGFDYLIMIQIDKNPFRLHGLYNTYFSVLRVKNHKASQHKQLNFAC